MKKFFLLITAVIAANCFSQETYNLRGTKWQIEKPETYLSDDNGLLDNPLFIFSVANESSLNSMGAEYDENEDVLENVAPEVFVFLLKDGFEKQFNNNEFKAEVNEAKQYIDNQKFYLVRSYITQLESGKQFYYDYYFSEINERMLVVVIAYDNDEDKKLMENAFVNSKFTTE